MAEKSDKKPVWVEEEAHAILKRYGSLVKKPMADVASELVLQHLSELSADGPSAVSAPEPVAAPVVEAAPAPVAVAPAPAPVEVEPTAEELAAAAAADEADARPARRRQRVDNEDTTIQYLGGVWLV